MTTKEDIRSWLERAEKDHTHMMVVYDSFCYENHPVFVSKGENVNEVYIKFINRKDIKNVMEVNDL